MKVHELIEILQTIPKNAEVVVRGYEDGVNKADHVVKCCIKPKEMGFPHDKNKPAPWYYGEYDVAAEQGEQAVFLGSSRDDMQE